METEFHESETASGWLFLRLSWNLKVDQSTDSSISLIEIWLAKAPLWRGELVLTIPVLPFHILHYHLFNFLTSSKRFVSFSSFSKSLRPSDMLFQKRSSLTKTLVSTLLGAISNYGRNLCVMVCARRISCLLYLGTNSPYSRSHLRCPLSSSFS